MTSACYLLRHRLLFQTWFFFPDFWQNLTFNSGWGWPLSPLQLFRRDQTRKYLKQIKERGKTNPPFKYFNTSDPSASKLLQCFILVALFLQKIQKKALEGTRLQCLTFFLSPLFRAALCEIILNTSQCLSHLLLGDQLCACSNCARCCSTSSFSLCLSVLPLPAACSSTPLPFL